MWLRPHLAVPINARARKTTYSNVSRAGQLHCHLRAPTPARGIGATRVWEATVLGTVRRIADHVDTCRCRDENSPSRRADLVRSRIFFAERCKQSRARGVIWGGGANQPCGCDGDHSRQRQLRRRSCFVGARVRMPRLAELWFSPVSPRNAPRWQRVDNARWIHHDGVEVLACDAVAIL